MYDGVCLLHSKEAHVDKAASDRSQHVCRARTMLREMSVNLGGKVDGRAASVDEREADAAEHSPPKRVSFGNVRSPDSHARARGGAMSSYTRHGVLRWITQRAVTSSTTSLSGPTSAEQVREREAFPAESLRCGKPSPLAVGAEKRTAEMNDALHRAVRDVAIKAQVAEAARR